MKKRISIIFKLLIVMLIMVTSIATVVIFNLYQDNTSDIIISEKVAEIRSSEEYVKLDQINDTFLKAIVAVEDHRFYNHGVIDIISIGRAFYENIKSGAIVQGGSTITQQLAKNLFLNNEQTLSRKVKEVILGDKIEGMYSKQEILELYVNVIYYGDGYTGIQEASEGYFNKEPRELSEDEATLLAGLPQAPSSYELSENYAAAENRQKEVIAALNNFKVYQEY